MVHTFRAGCNASMDVTYLFKCLFTITLTWYLCFQLIPMQLIQSSRPGALAPTPDWTFDLSMFCTSKISAMHCHLFPWYRVIGQSGVQWPFNPDNYNGLEVHQGLDQDLLRDKFSLSSRSGEWPPQEPWLRSVEWWHLFVIGRGSRWCNIRWHSLSAPLIASSLVFARWY